MSERSASDDLAWYGLDPARFALENKALKDPWRLVLDADGRYAWEGGSLASAWRNKEAPERTARLIYPYGFPARFIEARIESEPERELWGAYGAHVNVDGSACYVTADGWRAQDTAAEALGLLNDWWWNYYWVFERRAVSEWPARGRVEV